MDDRVCMHYVIDRIEDMLPECKQSEPVHQALINFRNEMIFNLGINQRIKLNEAAQPEPIIPASQFREDMNLKSAIDDLSNAYLEEAKRRVGKVPAWKSKVGKLLGFKTNSAFSYWLRQREKREEN